MKPMMPIGIALITAGVLYGLVSAWQNQNPFYSVPGQLDIAAAEAAQAWSWEPSPLWLPSYILCKCPRKGLGITHTRSGYLFRSAEARETYVVESMLIGGALGAGVGILIAWIIGRIGKTDRPRSTASRSTALPPRP